MSDISGGTAFTTRFGVVSDGTLAEELSVNGLHLISNDNDIGCLTIRNFSGNDIRIAGKDNIVKNCLIGCCVGPPP